MPLSNLLRNLIMMIWRGDTPDDDQLWGVFGEALSLERQVAELRGKAEPAQSSCLCATCGSPLKGNAVAHTHDTGSVTLFCSARCLDEYKRGHAGLLSADTAQEWAFLQRRADLWEKHARSLQAQNTELRKVLAGLLEGVDDYWITQPEGAAMVARARAWLEKAGG